MSIDNTHYQATPIQKIAALFLPCYAYVSMLAIPMTFSGIIEGFSVDAATATIATTAEISCIAIASLFVSVALGAIRPRTTMVIGILLALLGQYLTTQSSDFTFAVFARGLTGFGEGLCIGIGWASLAQMKGGTRLLSYSSGLIAGLSLAAFLVVPALYESLGWKSMFWFMLGLGVVGLGFAFSLSNIKMERLIATGSVGKGFNLGNIALFMLCVLTSMGANTLWLYFEQVGQAAGLEAPQVGVIGSVSMLISVLVPVASNIIFNISKTATPLIITCLLMAVTSYLYIVPNVSIFWAISISMTFLYVFLVNYARMYSSEVDNSGRTTAAVGGADSLGMVIGPVIAAITLNMNGSFVPLGEFGVVMQLLCIIPAFLIIYSRRTEFHTQTNH